MIYGSLVFFTIISLLVVIYKFYYKLTIGICRSQVCLVGKTAIVTGSNTGKVFSENSRDVQLLNIILLIILDIFI